MQIAFDVGNVLVEVDFDEFFMEFKRLGVREDPFTFLCDIQARQDIGIKTLKVSLKARFGLSEGQVSRLIEAWNNSIKPDDEMLDFVEELEAEGTKIAIMSNMGSEHVSHIRNAFPSIFEGRRLHLSSEVGARKPTKIYYQSFLMQHPHFVGSIFLDDREENVEMAKEFGFDARKFELSEFKKLSSSERKEKLNTIKGDVFKQLLHGSKKCRP